MERMGGHLLGGRLPGPPASFQPSCQSQGTCGPIGKQTSHPGAGGWAAGGGVGPAEPAAFSKLQERQS